MKIICKYVLRNIQEKKFRTFIIVLSVCISTAMLFASQSIKDSVMKIQEVSYKNNVGNSDVLVESIEQDPFFEMDSVDTGELDVDYKIGSVTCAGMYSVSTKNETFKIQGMDLDDVMSMNPITFLKGDTKKAFEGNQIIIGKYTASKYDLGMNDEIKLKINGNEETFTIYGISSLTGFFAVDGQVAIGIVPIKTLQSIIGKEDKVNLEYIKLKRSTEDNKLSAVNVINEINESYKAKESYSMADIKASSNTMSTQLLILLIIISVMSLFIINSSFKVLTVERIPVIGTFRSVGATKNRTIFVLALESFFYGVLGGITGCILGIGILYVMSSMCTPVDMKGAKVILEYSTLQFVISFLWAVVLSMISSIFPIIKVSKMQVKNIVLNLTESKVRKTNGFGRLVAGIIILVIALAILPFPPMSIAKVVDVISLLLIITSLYLISPYLINGVLFVLQFIYQALFGNIGMIAAKNLKNNKLIISNILLLELSIATIVSVFTVTGSVIDEISNLTVNSYFCDLRVKASSLSDSFVEELEGIDGVADAYGIYYQASVELPDEEDDISMIEGVNAEKYLDYRDFNYDGDKKSILEKLNEGRKILVTYSLRDKFGYKIGDKIKLTMNQKDQEYEVIGFFYSLLEHGGNFALISQDSFKEDFSIYEYSEVYVKTKGDIEKAEKSIQEKFVKDDIWTRTLKEQARLNNIQSGQKTNIFRGLAIVVLIIGVFGLLNNLTINFDQRKKSLAMYRSIGMSRKQSEGIVILESFSSGLIGGMLGLIGGGLVIFLSKYLMVAISRPFPLYCSITLFTTAFLASIVVNVIASIGLVSNTAKINIVETIKMD